MSKKSSSTPEKTSTNQPGPHISGMALTSAFTLYLVAFFAVIEMSAYNVSGGIILTVAFILVVVGTYILLGLKIAAQWEKAVVLRLGKFRRLAGPGLFWIIPIVDTIANWIDHRVMVTPFSAEKTLTNLWC